MNDITHTEEPAKLTNFNTLLLQQNIKSIYRNIAQNPAGEIHLETGREMAERLGYPNRLLDMVPLEAVNSFSGVGYHFHLANLKKGDSVLDLGSGSGLDSFLAANLVGQTGQVTGIDMTDEQLIKAECLRIQKNYNNIRYQKGYIENISCDDESFDVVISNGVINLSADKIKVFREVERLLKPGGRLVLSDIVTTSQLPENIASDNGLWAARIGGALTIDDYIDAINAAGLVVERVENNKDYHFVSEDVQAVVQEYDIKSISLVAQKQTLNHFMIW